MPLEYGSIKVESRESEAGHTAVLGREIKADHNAATSAHKEQSMSRKTWSAAMEWDVWELLTAQ